MSKAAEAQWDLGLPSNNIMDPTHTTVGGLALEQELSLSSACCQTEGGGTILLQLLEFKMHLLEVVEELHIRREAEIRFEDQISTLVLEKQELEWEKESLQQQSETVANQHTESLMNVRKQFQAKIRHIEEEKGKHQVSAELKDKEINNLKGELKSLQLLKYNLEKKSSELEQKLVLQSRSKDSHLNQLVEIEKRFSTLSRQCAMVKQAHEKLEQNVDEAMKRNKKLTSANEKLEATIVSLKKELEEVSSKLIKVKMSSVRLDKNPSLTGREQRIQQLHQKLNMETEMNKQLTDENVAGRAEKQEVMRSLQHTQQLLLTQTQTVNRVELELQMQREQYQALKQEHEVMREKSKATEDKVVQLMESYTASKTSWDKEKEVFLDRIKSEQQELQALKEAYDELHQKHTELSSQAKVQAQQMYELERRDSSQSLSVSPQLFPTLVEETRGEKIFNEHISTSEPPVFGSPQHLASSQTKKPDCLDDTEAVTRPVATGSPGEQETPASNQQSELKQPLNTSNLHTCPLNNNNLFELRSLSGTSGSDSSVSNKYMKNCNTSQSDPDVVSDLIDTASSGSANGLLISRGSNVSNTSGAAISGHMSFDASGDLLSKEKSDGGEKELGWKDEVEQGKSNREEEKTKEVQQWNKGEVQGENVKVGRSTTETRGMLMAKTTDTREDIQRSTEGSGDTKQPETETKDRTEGEGTDGEEERGKTRPHTPEMQIPAQTTTDTTTEKSDTQQVIDFMDTESPLAASEPSELPKSLSHDVSKMVADYRLVNKAYEMRREVHAFCSDEHQSVINRPNIEEVQGRYHDEPQTFAQDLLHQVYEKETPSDKPIANIPAQVFEPLNQSSVGNSQTNTVALPTQSDNVVSIQESETNATQTQPSKPSVITRNMEQTHEMCDAHVRGDCVLVTAMFEPRALPESQETSERECGPLRSLLTDDEDGDSSASMKREGQSNADTSENSTCETVPEQVNISDLKEACVDATMDTVTIESEAEAGSCHEHVKHENFENTGDEKKTRRDVCPRHESDASPETSSATCYVQSTAKEMLLEDTNESPLPSNKLSLDWSCAQRKTGSIASEQNQSGPGGLFRHPSTTMPRFLQSKHNKVPLVIASASDLLNASSVCGTAASWRRHQPGELKAMGETATADMESRASLSISSFPVSTSSVTRLPWQNTPGCSRAPAPGPSSGVDFELSCSQEREDQQSSFRAQISKIEQFLSAERLRLPKRRRTDN